jgi:protease-4
MNFFKNFLASLLAVVVGLGLIAMIQTMIFVGVIASMGSFGKSQTVIESGSVLRLNPGVITDSPATSPFAQFNFTTMTPTPHTNLLGTLRAIETAATDDRIKGIYMNLDEYSSISLPALEEIRAALVKF